MSINNVPVVSKQTKVFTIGSCFAIEIKRQLREHGFHSLPDFSSLQVDERRQYVNGLPQEEKYAFYDTFTIRQEYENTFTPWARGLESYWAVVDRPINKNTGWPTVYQDPYRKTTFGADLRAIEDVTKQLDTCIAQGIRDAEVHVITLGLIETWRVKATGRFSCRPPATGGAGGRRESGISSQ
ncbi:MAG: GSCFA domain-containing protein [Alphaproteobacteria bacterium]|nr:GSCFA domain-containing protein [Alphaproteobacteria bacterium]